MVRRPIPRWFDEGYAVVAAGQWNMLDALQVNLRVAQGRPISLREVNQWLRGTRAEAEAAYALAASCVLLLERWGGDRGITHLIEALRGGTTFEGALIQAYGLRLGQFEVMWQRELGKRYGWIAFAAATGFFWGVLGMAVIVLVIWRQRRNRARRAALDAEPEMPQILDDDQRAE